jgi:hypothetical protein
MSRVFHQRVALMSHAGDHIRYVPSALASALVTGGAARADGSAGRVRSVVLARSAESQAQRIGPPTDGGLSQRFYRWTRLDESASRIIEHHPRCMYFIGDDL